MTADHRPVRLTAPMLDVLKLLVTDPDVEWHGWAIMKATARSGGAIFSVLSRLEDLGWISSSWETIEGPENRPRLRLYRLSPNGVAESRRLLAEVGTKRQAAFGVRPGAMPSVE